jgi:putative ABC transport system substrate-binding protein
VIGRRKVIAGLGAAAAWPLATRAQQAALPVIGFLGSQTLGPYAERVAALHRGLRQGGYVEGANLAVEYRWAEGHDDRLPALAADLVTHKVKVITGLDSTTAVVAAKAATSSIPLVFGIGGDPVRSRLVESLRHPGGNVTGVSAMSNELALKRLGLLHELLPNAGTVAALANPSNPIEADGAKMLQEAAPAMGLTVKVISARNDREIDAFFATLVRERIPAFLTIPDSLFQGRSEQIVALAAHDGIAAIYETRNYADVGGLMSYGSDGIENWRQVGIYVSRILNGEKPADLPVIQPTKFHLVINLKTAKALGLAVPASLLATADEVIE